jgi:hypothetical protein
MSAITLNPRQPNSRLESRMSDHAEADYATADGNDYAAHEQTYETFISLTKVMIAVVATIVILMAYFLG